MLRKRPGYLLDTVLVLLIIGAAIFLVGRVRTGMHYTWHWRSFTQYFFKRENGSLKPNIIIQGFLTTVRLSFWVSLLALLIGTAGGIMGAGKSLFPRLFARTYVEFIRNTPPLVLIFIFYFFIGSQILSLLRIDDWIREAPVWAKTVITYLFTRPEQLGEFLSAVITLALYEGAYVTELVRGGLMNIPKGQHEATYVLGVSVFDSYLFVILPQVFRNILPSLTGQVISAIKDSSIVSIISIQELTFQGMELMASTYLIFEVWITITALYFVLTFSLSHLAFRLEKKFIR